MSDTDSTALSDDASPLLSESGYSSDMNGGGIVKGTPGQRLKQARQNAGFTTQREAAERLGFHKQNLSDHEADRRSISRDNAEAYGKAFRVKPGWILFGDGDVSPSSAVHPAAALRDVPLVGEVRAGAWSEVMEERIEGYIPVSMPEYDRAQMFALRVVGRSMDKVYPEGTTLICIPVSEAGVRAGDHVIVQRHKGGLVETTVKEVVPEKDGIALWPRSNDAAHQTPIRLTRDRESDEGPAIIAVVITHVPPPRRRDGPLLNL
jgi:SOS-response transcriptional repressor LexA